MGEALLSSGYGRGKVQAMVVEGGEDVEHVKAADDVLGGPDEHVAEGLGGLADWTWTGRSGFSGVSGITPLQNNLLPNWLLLWITLMRAVHSELVRFLILTDPLELKVTASL